MLPAHSSNYCRMVLLVLGWAKLRSPYRASFRAFTIHSICFSLHFLYTRRCFISLGVRGVSEIPTDSPLDRLSFIGACGLSAYYTRLSVSNLYNKYGSLALTIRRLRVLTWRRFAKGGSEENLVPPSGVRAGVSIRPVLVTRIICLIIACNGNAWRRKIALYLFALLRWNKGLLR
jgi:hypothetical protein